MRSRLHIAAAHSPPLLCRLQRVWTAAAAHLLDAETATALGDDNALLHAEGIFLFALAWSVGASAANVQGRTAFDKLMRAAVADKLAGAPFCFSGCTLIFLVFSRSACLCGMGLLRLCMLP